MAQQEWRPDIIITKVLAARCIDQQFPEIHPITDIAYIDKGWDNTVFLVNACLIFRFPHKKEAIALLERENSVLQQLQGRFELKIPNPVYLGKPTDEFPYPFQGYEQLAGTSACYTGLNQVQRAASIVPLAHFLKTLHNISVDQVRSLGVKPQVYDRTNASLAIASLQERVDMLKKKGIISPDMDLLEHEMSAAREIVLPRDKDCLVHGDLYCKHLLFDDEVLTGIIDWGDTGINSSAVDLSVIHGFFPAQYHEAFFEVYGPVDQATWDYARFIAIRYAYTLMLYAHDTDDTMLFDESQQSLEWLRQCFD